ncbi:hypothetical protein MOQ_000152, partial [Trypanosoma cruzi marinkellei]
MTCTHGSHSHCRKEPCACVTWRRKKTVSIWEPRRTRILRRRYWGAQGIAGQTRSIFLISPQSCEKYRRSTSTFSPLKQQHDEYWKLEENKKISNLDAFYAHPSSFLPTYFFSFLSFFFFFSLRAGTAVYRSFFFFFFFFF